MPTLYGILLERKNESYNEKANAGNATSGICLFMGDKAIIKH